MRERMNDLRVKISTGWVLTIGITLILILCIFLIFDSVMVVGSSMLPNFVGGTVSNPQKGDKVILSRIYGLDYGDVIVFYDENLDENLIKRVIGLEGDEIQIVGTNLYRNGKLVEENYINEPMRYSDGKWSVKENEIFVLGDNRNVSHDSRAMGPINKKSVIGEVIIKVDSASGKIYFM